MDHDAAIDLLGSPNFNVRLRAARFLSQSAQISDVETLEFSLKNEKNSWVKQALQNALIQAQGHNPSYPRTIESPSKDEVDQRLVDDVYARAVRQTSRKLVHDVGRLIGLLQVQASADIENYQTTKTKVEVDRIKSLIKAIECLGESAAVPYIGEFNLSKVIKDVARSECQKNSIHCEIQGPDPLIAKGDENLLQLILTSGFRNAIESLGEIQAEQNLRIVASYGESDREYWVSIIDNGTGPPANSADLFEIGTTTKKKGHFGLGLAQAKTAILSLRGKIVLDRENLGGANLSFSWPKEPE